LHTYNTPGLFTIRVKMGNGCTDTTISLQVEVFLKPLAAFTTNGTVFCAGDTIRITGNTSVNANAYRWNWGDGSSSTGATPVHVYAAGGTYTITLFADKVVNQGIVCTGIAQLPITIADKPVLNISSNISAVNCIPFRLTASATALTNETAVWTITDSTVSPSVITINGSNAQYSFNKPGTFTVKLWVQNAAGCKDSITRTFQVFNKAKANINPTLISTCNTDTLISYTNGTTYTGNDVLTYNWLVNSALVSVNANLSYQYTLAPGGVLPATFTTSLVAINSVGCRDTARSLLTMQPRAKAVFTALNAGDCVPFNLQVNNGSLNATTYQWFLNGAPVSTAASPAIPIPQPSTAYTVTLIADNAFGCRPDTLRFSFTTRAKPRARFSVNDSVSCTGNLNLVTNNQSAGAIAYTWIWGDNTPNSNLVSPTHNYPVAGEYLVTLIASDGVCTDTVEKRVRIAEKIVVNFSPSIRSGCDTISVQFTNQSLNAISYNWDFGDGSFSQDINPVHSYAPNILPYTVKLVATGKYNCKDSITRPNLIRVQVPPKAAFIVLPNPIISVPNYSFRFVNTTQRNSFYDYTWYFGDGKSDTSRDISLHTYADTGSYMVELIVFDRLTGCSDTARQLVQITGQPGYLYLPNAMCMSCTNPLLRSFLPVGKGLAEYKLQILTTWGELVFETDKLDVQGRPSQAWDGSYKGQQLPQDVYMWKVVTAKFRNGSNWGGMKYENGGGVAKNVGTITVIR
jgi:PKD repeat protein